MKGLITLVGAGEYLPVMEDVDRYLLDTVNVKTPHVVCLPTAAGQVAVFGGPTVLVAVARWDPASGTLRPEKVLPERG